MHSSYWRITLSSRYAILSHTFNGIWIYDVSQKDAPVLVDHAAFPTERSMSEIITLSERTLRVSPVVFPFDITRASYVPVLGVAVAEGRLYAAAEGVLC